MKMKIDRFTMPFGKYQGLLLNDIPLKYLDWLQGAMEAEGQKDDIVCKVIKQYLSEPALQRELNQELDEL